LGSWEKDFANKSTLHQLPHWAERFGEQDKFEEQQLISPSYSSKPRCIFL
jgi:hypothetical protein